ncbi:hypothetical protein [Aquibacillus rhizosphaerae]|uniref:Uncharacterized protein n=1 Tax=Aquibacillus rhizosphaerae TaxID=3051431 RepID=A0ABT7LAA8_9BACI|nr:hypothetical protein [Aquibacillus sp. LR5S19]MDL4842803.1 hypothetical protein [Aquibacillus sp. LR5S19]
MLVLSQRPGAYLISPIQSNNHPLVWFLVAEMELINPSPFICFSQTLMIYDVIYNPLQKGGDTYALVITVL